MHDGCIVRRYHQETSCVLGVPHHAVTCVGAAQGHDTITMRDCSNAPHIPPLKNRTFNIGIEHRGHVRSMDAISGRAGLNGY
jgi:hypothetical protein